MIVQVLRFSFRAKVVEIFKQYHAVNKNSDLAIHKKRVACQLPCLQISSNFVMMIMKRMGASTAIESVLLSQIIAFSARSSYVPPLIQFFPLDSGFITSGYVACCEILTEKTCVRRNWIRIFRLFDCFGNQISWRLVKVGVMFGLHNLILLELGSIHEAEFMGVILVVITIAGSQLMNWWTGIRREKERRKENRILWGEKKARSNGESSSNRLQISKRCWWQSMLRP
ncbi:hypothetical protein TIFTF001_025958 [Ficus carica]|uniref:Uncharacterized protein n=1 Tax=Ficus carica TaxID=3494 RepID=A0AA88DGW7_FICCA|nr:hypothetical protein TIFTF001_025958 [Ficus carica]